MSTTSREPIAAAELARIVADGDEIETLDIDRLHRRMGATLVEHLCGLTGRPARDVDGVWTERDGDILLYAGHAVGLLRLLVSIEVDDAMRSASVTLRAAKGPVAVDRIDWGAAGPEVGNSILVARLLHIGIQVLRAEGLVLLTNNPWDARLRAHYELMGFVGGERLPLDDEAPLTRAFGYIERSYRRFGLRLTSLV